ncbi:unnamed protein product [Cochlearia groenlandica]
MEDSSSFKFQKSRSSFVFSKGVTDVVKGVNDPKNRWITDVEVVYGIVFMRAYLHWFDMSINLKKHLIIVLDCESA